MSASPGASRSLRQRALDLLANRSEFTRNLAKLSSGTILRTVIAFGTMPIATRLYAPEDFGNLQLLLSIVTTFTAVAALRYEVTIVLPQDRQESQNLAVLSLYVVALLAVLLSVFCWFWGPWLLAQFDAGRLEPYLGLIVVGFVAGGVLRVSHHNLIATKQFGSLARNTVAQVSVTQGGYIGLGLWKPSFLGLFGSQMLGYAVGIAASLRRAPIRSRGVRLRTLAALARRYRKFPLVNSPGVFVNSLAYEMPVFLLARFFDAEIVGFYMLTDRLLNQPAAMIGQALAKVYLQAAAAARNEGGGRLRSLFRRTAGRLLLVSAPFMLVVIAAAPFATHLFLGEGYREVGVMMRILVVGSFLRFVSSPLIATFTVVNRQEVGMTLMVLSGVASFAVMLVFSEDAHDMLWALAGVQAAFSLIFLAAIDRVLARVDRHRAEGPRPPAAADPADDIR